MRKRAYIIIAVIAILFPFRDMHFTRCRSLLLIKKYKTQPPAKAGGSNCQSPLCFRLLKSGGRGTVCQMGFLS